MLLRGNNIMKKKQSYVTGTDEGEGAGGAHPLPPHKRTCGFLNSIWGAKKRIDAHKTLSFHVQTATFI